MDEEVIELLLRVADALKTQHALMGSKWRSCEAEIIAFQTLKASAKNYRKHGEAMSWAGTGLCLIQNGGIVNNPKGLGRLLADNSLVVDQYDGPLRPEDADDIQIRDGKFVVLRPTPELVRYAASMVL